MTTLAFLHTTLFLSNFFLMDLKFIFDNVVLHLLILLDECETLFFFPSSSISQDFYKVEILQSIRLFTNNYASII
jgi:hypothetical protein